MRISDWSSDVCSSDLRAAAHAGGTCAALPLPVECDRCRTGLGSRVSRSSIPLVAVCARGGLPMVRAAPERSEEHTSELQSLMRISYAVFCLKKKNKTIHKKKHSLP